jgi:undecaprenyl-phosphate 4-deoxy-4-formamido-L-arabinose transferase
MDTSISIILPIYNQEDHIEKLYFEYREALTTLPCSWELLFIVNGSLDSSFKRISSLAKEDENVLTYNLKKGGWGRAVKYGISKANGQYICYTNSARTKVNDLLMILDYALVNKNNIIKANRIVRESFFRRLGSVLYNFENRRFFKTPVWDVNGTPKVFPAQIIKNIDIISENDLIDAELIARTFKAKHPIIEIPILSTERISGKSTTNIKSAIKMYFGLFTLRKRI